MSNKSFLIFLPLKNWLQGKIDFEASSQIYLEMVDSKLSFGIM